VFSKILPCSHSGLQELFASTWAAFDGRALSTSLEKERRDNTAAFISAVSECVGFLARRLFLGNSDKCETSVLAVKLVEEQWRRLWEVCLSDGFKLSEHVLGTLFAKGLQRLNVVDNGELRCQAVIIGSEIIQRYYLELFHLAWKPFSRVSLRPAMRPQIDPVLFLASLSEQLDSSSTVNSANQSSSSIPQSVLTATVTEWALDAARFVSSISAGSNLSDPTDNASVLRELDLCLQHFYQRFSQDGELQQVCLEIL
jgi:hypothetical protein